MYFNFEKVRNKLDKGPRKKREILTAKFFKATAPWYFEFQMIAVLGNFC